MSRVSQVRSMNQKPLSWFFGPSTWKILFRLVFMFYYSCSFCLKHPFIFWATRLITSVSLKRHDLQIWTESTKDTLNSWLHTLLFIRKLLQGERLIRYISLNSRKFYHGCWTDFLNMFMSHRCGKYGVKVLKVDILWCPWM